MKGLLLKDFFTLMKQMKIFFVVLLVWSFLPGLSTSNFAIVYAAMLPITALAYDERSKWNSLAAMLPYSAKSIVLSKYVLGYISISGAALFSLLAQVLVSLIQKKGVQPENLLPILFILCMAVIIQAVNLPLMFKLGVEKARFFFILFIAGIVGGGVALSATLTKIFESISIPMPLLTIGAVLLLFLINLISIVLSIRIFKAKEF